MIERDMTASYKVPLKVNTSNNNKNKAGLQSLPLFTNDILKGYYKERCTAVVGSMV